MRSLRDGRAGWIVVALPVIAVIAGFLVYRSWGGHVISTDAGKVLVSKRTGSGMDALGFGELRFVGGCLGAADYVIIWPHGTKVVDEDPITVKVPEYGKFALGEDVRIGGGFVLEHDEPHRSGSIQVAGVSVPPKCAEHDVFLAN